MTTNAQHTRSWLWPDRTIGKRESRELREEHNRVINLNAGLLDTLRMVQVACDNVGIKLDKAFVWSRGGWSQSEGHGERIYLLDAINAAIAKATGR